MRPTEDLVNDQYVLISKAAALTNNGDAYGAHEMLMLALKRPGKHEIEIIQRILKLNESEIMKKSSAPEKIYRQNIKLLERVHELNGDPFNLYRIGQIHMFLGERDEARNIFSRVVAQAPQRVYYYPAALKLLEKLSN